MFPLFQGLFSDLASPWERNNSLGPWAFRFTVFPHPCNPLPSESYHANLWSKSDLAFISHNFAHIRFQKSSFFPRGGLGMDDEYPDRWLIDLGKSWMILNKMRL
jgi:hypothetical protein